MNWFPFLIGIAGIVFFGWLILAARKENKRMNSKK